jgi:hypothetical protein
MHGRRDHWYALLRISNFLVANARLSSDTVCNERVLVEPVVEQEILEAELAVDWQTRETCRRQPLSCRHVGSDPLSRRNVKSPSRPTLRRPNRRNESPP